MLSRFLSIILVIGIQAIFVVGQDYAPPVILTADDPNIIFQPLAGQFADKNADDAIDNPKVIRGLLVMRQDKCPIGYAMCNDGG